MPNLPTTCFLSQNTTPTSRPSVDQWPPCNKAPYRWYRFLNSTYTRASRMRIQRPDKKAVALSSPGSPRVRSRQTTYSKYSTTQCRKPLWTKRSKQGSQIIKIHPLKWYQGRPPTNQVSIVVQGQSWLNLRSLLRPLHRERQNMWRRKRVPKRHRWREITYSKL